MVPVIFVGPDLPFDSSLWVAGASREPDRPSPLFPRQPPVSRNEGSGVRPTATAKREGEDSSSAV